MELEEHIPLARLTSFHVGGRARFFARVRDTRELQEAVSFARGKNLPFFVLGGGSNILVSDDGFSGMVIQIDIKGITHQKDGNDVLVAAAAGENWDDFVSYTVAHNWQGIENLSGIPGTVGGAPVQNIGCYGSEASDTIESVTVFDTETGSTKIFPKDACGFTYRKSMFNTTNRGKYVVVEVVFRLRSGGEPMLKYENVIAYFKNSVRKPTVAEVRSAVLAIRSEKGTRAGMYRNAGSFFKNAIVTDDTFKHIQEIVLRERDAIPGGCCLDPWHWDLGGGKYKIAAACLVHCSGFVPGTCEGNVGTLPKQTLVVTNFKEATAHEVMTFVRKITTAVEKKFGVVLEIEPELVGF